MSNLVRGLSIHYFRGTLNIYGRTCATPYLHQTYKDNGLGGNAQDRRFSTSSVNNRKRMHKHYRDAFQKAISDPLATSRGGTPAVVEPSQENVDKLLGEEFLRLSLRQEANETFVDAELVDSGREKHVISSPNKEACVLCRLNLRNLNYTDVLILSQFIKKDGSLATYHESKLCTKQYYRINRLIKQAQRCNLIQRPHDYFVPGPWHDLNTYIEKDRKRDQPMKVIKKDYWRI